MLPRSELELPVPLIGKPSSAAESSSAAWYALGVLTLITLFAFVDRGVLVLQAEVIRKSMGLSDTQLGFLQGTGVAIFAALAAYPLGWLADRFDRRWVLAGCLLLWSAAVVGSGLAQSYEALVLTSALVGAGEAGLVPIVYALIPELFSEKKRQIANSVYSLATGATGALALALCGLLVGWVELARPELPLSLQNMEGWRLSFLAVVLPTPLLVLLIATIRVRKRRAAADDAALSPPPRQAAAPLVDAGAAAPALMPYMRLHWKTFAGFFGGAGLAMMAFGAVGTWLAVIYMRVFGETQQQLGSMLGALALGGTVFGFVFSIYGLRYFSRRLGNSRVNVRSLWIGCLCAAGGFTLMIFATNARQMYAIHGLYIVLVTTTTMVYPTAVQGLAPSYLRGRVAALMGVLGASVSAIAPLTVGLVSDQFKHLPNGLIVAAVSVAVPALLLAAVLLFWCERNYVKTAEAARLADEALA